MTLFTTWNPVSVCLVLSVAAVWTWALLLVRQGKSAEAEQFIESVVTRVLAKRLPNVTQQVIVPPATEPNPPQPRVQT